MPRSPSPASLTLRSSFWLMAGDQSLAGRGRIELLERIDDTGSIRQAALGMGMSYRAAWDAVDLMSKRSGRVLVARRTGGKGGGGAGLSDDGRALVRAYRRLEVLHARHVTRLSDKLGDLLAR